MHILAALVAFCIALWAPLASAKDVTIGVFVYQGERAATEDWSPILDYLQRTLPEHRFRLEQYDVDGLRTAIAAEQGFDLSTYVVTAYGAPRATR